MRRWGLSVRETAKCFLLDPSTIYEWLKDLRDHPDTKAIGTRIKPVPPLRRIGDATRRLAKQMHEAGFTGAGKVAQNITRVARDSISKSSAWRFRKEKLPPALPSTGPQIETPVRQIKAREPLHVLLMDVTEIQRAFYLPKLYLACVLDVFSRMPLTWATYTTKPTAVHMGSLLTMAVRTYGSPRHLITDQGGEFTGEEFIDAVDRHGIRQRFGAVGKSGSIAIIERLWKTLKYELHLKT